MSLWKLQQHRNCKSKLQRNHYRLCLKYHRYDLYRRRTATSTFMLQHPIATISYSKNINSYHKSCPKKPPAVATFVRSMADVGTQASIEV
jgi:hypothetical protein